MSSENLREWLAKCQMALYCKSKGWEVDDWNDLPDSVHQKYYDEADQILSRLKSQIEQIPTLRELQPDVDAAFGQEVCCNILPKYIPDAGRVSNECYKQIIGLAYDLADTIAQLQKEADIKHILSKLQ